MKRHYLINSLTAIISVVWCLALVGRGANADDRANANTIKELQKLRLSAVTAARDYLVRQWRQGYLATAVNTSGFLGQLLGAHDLVYHARLDLCDTKAERIQATEEAIKAFEPIVAQFEKNFQAGIADSVVPYRLGQAQLLQLKIDLEKTKEPRP